MSRLIPSYSTDELKVFLEKRLGKLVLFKMVLQCSRPENFWVETARGERLVVKCVVPKGDVTSGFYERFLPHLEELKTCPEAVHLVYGPWDFNGRTVVALARAGGGRILPDRLTAAQKENLLRAYGSFSDAMQRASNILPPRDSLTEFQETRQVLDSFGCRFLRDRLLTMIPEESLAYDPKRLKVIHGDFHHGNLHFDCDRVSGILDFEEFRYGYAADDWVRYLVCGAEHLKWFDFAGRRRILKFFSELLPLAPADEWHLAVNSLLVRKLHRRFAIKRSSAIMKMLLAQKMRFRLGFYHALHARISMG